MASREPKSPGEGKKKCDGCGKEFEKLRSHVKRTKGCQDSYDMDALDEEAERLHKDQMAARNREVYHNDPEKSSRKKDYYHRDIQKTSD